MLTRTGNVEAASSHGGDHRHLGHDLAAADARCVARRFPPQSAGVYPSDSTPRQSADQRAAHRHRLQRPLQHGPAEERLRSLRRSSWIRHWRAFSTPRRLVRLRFRAPPRTDLLPLVTYAPPIAAARDARGPDRRSPAAEHRRDPDQRQPARAGSGCSAAIRPAFPTAAGCSTMSTDIALRAVAGVLNPSFNKFPNNTLGDGVNVNDAPYRIVLPVSRGRAERPQSPSHRSRRTRMHGRRRCPMPNATS